MRLVIILVSAMLCVATHEKALSSSFAGASLIRPNAIPSLVQKSALDADGGVNVRDYGAICDGSTNNAAAFSAAFAAADVVHFDLRGCTSHYLINTTVSIPAGKTLLGPSDGLVASLGLLTTANVDTFAVAGDRFTFRNMRLEHRGSSGRALDLGSASYGKITDFSIVGTNAGNGQPLVIMTGSLNVISAGTFTNQRINAYALQIDGVGTTPPIVDRVENVNFGGSGLGILVGSSSGTTRPEGIYLTNNHCFLSNVCLGVTSVNDLRSIGNTYDVGATAQVILNAIGQGIDLVSFENDYFSTLNQPKTGVCLAVQGSGGINRLRITSKFAYCGYGVAAQDGYSSNIDVFHSSFSQVKVAVNLQNVKGAIVESNNCSGCNYNFIMADGANGGPYVISGNLWDPAGTILITATDPEKFIYGSTNSGKKLSGYSTSGAAIFTATGCLVTSFPHGLASAPNLARITLTPSVVSGSPTNVTAAVMGADGTYINAQICAVITNPSTIRLVTNASL